MLRRKDFYRVTFGVCFLFVATVGVHRIIRGESNTSPHATPAKHKAGVELASASEIKDWNQGARTILSAGVKGETKIYCERKVKEFKGSYDDAYDYSQSMSDVQGVTYAIALTQGKGDSYDIEVAMFFPIQEGAARSQLDAKAKLSGKVNTAVATFNADRNRYFLTELRSGQNILSTMFREATESFAPDKPGLFPIPRVYGLENWQEISNRKRYSRKFNFGSVVSFSPTLNLDLRGECELVSGEDGNLYVHTKSDGECLVGIGPLKRMRLVRDVQETLSATECYPLAFTFSEITETETADGIFQTTVDQFEMVDVEIEDCELTS